MAQRTKKSDTNSYRKTVLNNGLRVVTEKIPSVRSITLGIWIDVGSRNESKDINGVSHLIEHMLFKGTKNRDRKSTRLNSSHTDISRMPSSA